MPSEASKHTASAFAVVILKRDGHKRTFTGIGDASPANRNIAAHLCRIAETWSKARALSDAFNVGMSSVEELAPMASIIEGKRLNDLAKEVLFLAKSP